MADRDGVAAVEFAMVAPVFFLLIIGMIELSLVMMADAILQSAVGLPPEPGSPATRPGRAVPTPSGPPSPA